MIKRVVNIGVLAHVDAGKTSLSERLLFDNGAITELGSVDAGSTATDTNELERERGITIRSAVVAFALGDLQVNLVDTPGHPDFIAEVERALSVLDGAILVISAVEGIQAQTKILMRSLRQAQIPTLIFINKIDRAGARPNALLDRIKSKLGLDIIPMNSVCLESMENLHVIEHALEDFNFKQRIIDKLIDHDLDLLLKVVDEQSITEKDIKKSLLRLTTECKIFPVFNGSALKGIGSKELAEGIRTFLPSGDMSDSSKTAQGIVFAIERLASGEKIAYLRLMRGKLREREEVKFIQTAHSGVVQELSAKVTGLSIVGESLRSRCTNDVNDRQKLKVLTSGNIARVRGLAGIRVGANLGSTENAAPYKHFPPPALEAVIRPRRIGQERKLHAALLSLSDEDPLIHATLTGDGGASVLLYGEVQKEVLMDRLIREFDVEPEFSTSSPIYVERPIAVGEAEYVINPLGHNDFWATIGIRLIPTEIGRGNRFVREVLWGLMPAGFYRAIEESAMETLTQGLLGWRITDCSVHLVKLGYDRPVSVAADFRNLTPILVMRALKSARTRLYEPCYSFELEIPEDSLGNVISFLSTHGAEIAKTEYVEASTWLISGELPVRVTQDVATALPGLTHGEALLTTLPGSDRPVRGEVPLRSRTDGNPLNYEEYMRYLSEAGLMR